jgi:thiol:disulfide interchange protein DsbC
VKNVTVYTFLYPILGADSTEKSKAIWCAKDNTKAWRDWMIKGTPVENSPNCDVSALAAQLRLRQEAPASTARRAGVRGRQPRAGRLNAEAIEKLLVASQARQGLSRERRRRGATSGSSDPCDRPAAARRRTSPGRRRTSD